MKAISYIIVAVLLGFFIVIGFSFIFGVNPFIKIKEIVPDFFREDKNQERGLCRIVEARLLPSYVNPSIAFVKGNEECADDIVLVVFKKKKSLSAGLVASDIVLEEKEARFDSNYEFKISTDNVLNSGTYYFELKILGNNPLDLKGNEFKKSEEVSI